MPAPNSVARLPYTKERERSLPMEELVLMLIGESHGRRRGVSVFRGSDWGWNTHLWGREETTYRGGVRQTDGTFHAETLGRGQAQVGESLLTFLPKTAVEEYLERDSLAQEICDGHFLS